MFRLFFDDKPKRSRKSSPGMNPAHRFCVPVKLGAGLNLPRSDTVMMPMMNVTSHRCGSAGRRHRPCAAPISIGWQAAKSCIRCTRRHRDLIPEPFRAATPLHATRNDTEVFGTVTAPLARNDPRWDRACKRSRRSNLEWKPQPLLALLTFEVASPKVEAPPEIYLNGEDLGPVTLVLPDLADPGYRGEMRSLVRQMQYRYTGWMRAQKLLPAVAFESGNKRFDHYRQETGRGHSAIRATQIQLKYLWEKSDYLLRPDNRIFMKRNNDASRCWRSCSWSRSSRCCWARPFTNSAATWSTRATCAFQRDIQGIGTQLKLYESMNGFLPDNGAGSAGAGQRSPAPIRNRRVGINFTKSCPRIRGTTTYIYLNPGRKNPNGYDLYSAGQDRKPDTADDDWGGQLDETIVYSAVPRSAEERRPASASAVASSPDCAESRHARAAAASATLGLARAECDWPADLLSASY